MKLAGSVLQKLLRSRTAARQWSARVLVLVFSMVLAPSCGRVIVDGDLATGGGGSGGGEEGEGGASGCNSIECDKPSVSFCSCETHCTGPNLRADCELQDDGVVCECHLSDAYLGLCWTPGSEVCGLPDGCCYAFIPQ